MQDPDDDNTYAVKIVNRQKIRKRHQLAQVNSELEILSSLRCPFICTLIGSKEDSYGFYLLLELAQGGQLTKLIYPSDKSLRAEHFTIIKRGGLAGLPHDPAKFYISGVSLALAYLHRKSIVYRSLKVGNIMIGRNGYPKLIDLGLAKRLDQTEDGKTYSMCGTPQYIAPEMISGRGHNQSVDWWTLGVVLYEMIVGITPFMEPGDDMKDPTRIFENIVKNNVNFPKNIEPDCLDLITKLLKSNPLSRMGCGQNGFKELTHHKWFINSVDWKAMKKQELQAPWIPKLKDNTDVTFLKIR